MNLLKIFSTHKHAADDYRQFLSRNGPSIVSARRATLSATLLTGETLHWVALGPTDRDAEHAASRLLGMRDMVVLHVDRYVLHTHLDMVLPYCGRPGRATWSHVPAACMVCGEVNGHLGLPCPKMSPTAHWSEGV
jgi:hypothetical protein